MSFRTNRDAPRGRPTRGPWGWSGPAAEGVNRSFRLSVEALEDRVVPALVAQRGDFVMIGNTLAQDAGPGVIAPVNGTVGGVGTNTSDTAPDVYWRADSPTNGSATADTTITALNARTTAVLNLPAGATVTHAYLYWAGTGAPDNNALIERPGTFSQSVTATATYTAALNGPAYMGVTDVTALVQQYGTGAYRIGDVDSLPLADVNHSSLFAGWSIVVIYARSSDPFRTFFISDQLNQVLSGGSTTITLNGFTVSNPGGRLGVIAFDGDDSLSGDGLSVNGIALSNANNPANNIFNGTRTNNGAVVSDPNDLPRLTGGPRSMSGIDIDTFDLAGALAGGQTQATAQATTNSDVYLVGPLVLAINSFAPEFGPSTLTATDVNGGPLLAGDVVTYTVTVQNLGDDASVGSALAAALPTGVTYVPGSIHITSGSNTGTQTDATGDDEGGYDPVTRTVSVNLGSGAGSGGGGRIGIAETTTVTFQVIVNVGATQVVMPVTVSGASETGTTAVATTLTSTLTVTSNTAPTLTDLDGDSVPWAGVGNTVRLDAGTPLTIGDADLDALNGGLGDWAGAALTVWRSGTAVTTDVFGFDLTGALFTVNGNTLEAGGLVFATFTSTAGVLTVTFTSPGTAATTALVQDVLRRVTYRNDTPAGDASVRFELSDGVVAAAATVTVTSNEIYVNDAGDTADADRNTITLREAALIAAAQPGAQTIRFTGAAFAAPQTIALGSALALDANLTLDASGAAGVTITGAGLQLGGALTYIAGAGDSDTIAVAITGSGSITKAGAGTLTLSGTNTYTGTTTVSGGTLSIASGTNLGAGTVALAAGATLDVTGATTLANTITGAGTLTKTGAGTLTLSGTNSYGTTVVAGGTLNVASDANLGTGTVTLGAGTTLDVTGATTINNAVTLTGAATINNAVTVIVSGVISGANNLTKVGAGTLTLSGTNTYTGTTTVSAGTLSVAADANLGTGAVSLAAGTILDVTGATTVDNAVTLTGAATIRTGADVLLSGIVGGAFALTKTGTGALTLSAASTHSGTFTISAGTVFVTGTLASSAVVVSAGAVLGGTGTVTGPVTAAGTVAAGVAGVGVLTLSGGVTFQSGGTVAVDLNGNAAGTGYDQVATGPVVLTGATLSAALGFAPSSGTSFVVINNTGGSPITGTFNGLPEGATVTIGGVLFTISYVGGTGNDVVLTVPVPPTVSIGDVTASEGADGLTAFVFTVRLSGPSFTPVTVLYTTVGGTAVAGTDFVSTTGALTFAPGVTELTVLVSVIGDPVPESDESFAVVLTGAANATVARGTATGTIADDDPPRIVIGVGTSGATAGIVQPVNPLTGALGESVRPYAGFAGDVRVSSGDIDGDGLTDMITGAGPGPMGGHVKVLDGRTGADRFSFLAFEGFRGGVQVSTGDIDGDGHADIIVAADAGAVPHVKVFSGRDGSLLRSFLAYDAGFRGGVRVSAADVNGDGFDDVVTMSGIGSAPHLRVFSGADGTDLVSVLVAGRATGGLYVAAGDLDGDGRAEVVTGAGFGDPPIVNVYSGRDESVQKTFLAYLEGFVGGVRVGVEEVNGRAMILTGAGPGAGPHLCAFESDGGDPPLSMFVGSTDVHGGVYVG